MSKKKKKKSKEKSKSLDVADNDQFDVTIDGLWIRKHIRSSKVQKLCTNPVFVIKIIIIGFFSIYVIGGAVPYYFGADSLVYGATVFSFSKGSYEYTNELMQRFDGGPFSPAQWAPTVHDTAVPAASVGIIVIGAISYFIAGEYGIFYVGPIATILLFIFTERITTKLFGSFAGLIALIFVATDFFILYWGRFFLTDNIFALFVILGCYYLVKFFYERKEKHILLCSIFFSISALVRINGVIIFPVEILLISLYFLYLAYSRNILKKNSYLTISNHITKLVTLKIPTKFFKISFLLLIPWLIFFFFFFSYNLYYFGDPLTTYSQAEGKLPEPEKNFLLSFVIIDSERLDWIKYYSIGSLPDRIKYGLADAFSINDVSFTDTIIFQGIHLTDNNWVGIFTFVIILSAVAISFIFKTKRTEVSILVFLFLGLLLFLTWPYLRGSYDNAEFLTADLQERYMFPNLVFSSMLFSFIMIKVYEIDFEKIAFAKGRFITKGFKIIFLLILGLLLFTSFYYSKPMLDVLESTFELKDLRTNVRGFPFECGFPEKSILVTPGRSAILCGTIPFNTQYVTFEKKLFDPTIINDNDIRDLIDVMDEGYTVFTYKAGRPEEPKFFRYLEAEHGLILKSISSSYCKMERLTMDVNLDTKSDDICYRFLERQSVS